MSFKVIATWKQSTDPDFVTKKNRIRHQYALMDGTDDDPDVVICMDQFGLLTSAASRPAKGGPTAWERAASPPTAGDLHPPECSASPAKTSAAGGPTRA